MSSEDSGYDDGDSLTNKIAAWGSMVPYSLCFVDVLALKVENAIARPDGLGTGNAHRGGTVIPPQLSISDSVGPNYRPIASVLHPMNSPSPKS